MTDKTTAQQSQELASLQNTVATIAKNKLLSALVVPVDTFLTTLQTNQAGTPGIIAAVDVLKAQAIQALPVAGAGTIQGVAGALKTEVDADVAKAEAGTDTEAGNTAG
jgi:hypothetical protein